MPSMSSRRRRWPCQSSAAS